MNKFISGEKVVCINNMYYEYSLTIGKTYTVIRMHLAIIFLIGDDDVFPDTYSYLRFCSLKEYRRLKIQSLYDEI